MCVRLGAKQSLLQYSLANAPFAIEAMQASLSWTEHKQEAQNTQRFRFANVGVANVGPRKFETFARTARTKTFLTTDKTRVLGERVL